MENKNVKQEKKHSVLLTAVLFFLTFTVITGGIYPAVCTAIAQVLFPSQANGSIIEIDGKKYGSALLAQEFVGDEYLHGRVMNVDTGTWTDDDGNVAIYSAPSNKTPAGAELEEAVAERVAEIKAENPDMGDTPVPVDLVTNSGSGLDPEISPAGAEYQVKRIAKARGISEDEVREVIKKYTRGKTLGVLGEPGVNVLKVNLALDGILK